MLGGLNRAFDHLYILKNPGTAFLPEKKSACDMLGGLDRVLKINKVPQFAPIRRYLPLVAAIRCYSSLFAAICRYIHCNIRRYLPLIPPKIGSHRWQPKARVHVMGIVGKKSL